MSLIGIVSTADLANAARGEGDSDLKGSSTQPGPFRSWSDRVCS